VRTLNGHLGIYFLLYWDRLHKEVEAFTNWISPTPVEDEVRGLVVELITRAVVNAFPDASVNPFGSYETKLYLPLGYVNKTMMRPFNF